MRSSSLALGVAALVAASTALAEEGAPSLPGRRLSIQEAMELAERTSEIVAINEATVERARARRTQARADWFPQLDATLTYDRTFATEFAGLFGSDSTFDGQDNLPFGRANIWRGTVRANWIVFSGLRTWASVRAASALVSSARVGVLSARAQAVLDGAQAYYDAVLSEQLVSIAEATLEQAELTYRQTKLAFEAGNQSEFDLLRAQVSRDTQMPVVVQRRTERDLAYFRLKQLLELPLSEPLVLTSPLDPSELEAMASYGRTLAGIDYPSGPRAPVRQALLDVTANEENVTVARSSHWPELSLNTSYGRVSYPGELLPDLANLRTNWTAGFVLSIPIFAGFRVVGQVNEAQALLLDARARLRQVVELASLDTQSSTEQLDAALAQYRATFGTVLQAERAHAIAELRYQQGISTQLELSDARLQLATARVNRARAARDVEVARIRVALLPNLPLSQGGQVSAQGATGTSTIGGTSSQQRSTLQSVSAQQAIQPASQGTPTNP